MNQQLLLGAHLFGSVTPYEKFSVAYELGLQSFQVFTAPNISYSLDFSLKDTVIDSFKRGRKQFEHIKVFSHACYLLNIADRSKEENYQKSVAALILELKRASVLGIEGVVLHPGSFVDRKIGLTVVAETINKIYSDYNFSVYLYIESSAGQGNTLPTTIEEMRILYDELIPHVRERVKFVLDTCHVHASGFDLSTGIGVNTFLNQFEEVLGIDALGLIHLNDSVYGAGSRRDRHQNIGKGTIGIEGMTAILKYKKLFHVHKILETPVQDNMLFKEDIEILRGLVIS